MSYSFLKELQNLKVVVVHPLDEEGSALMDHLRRIGCVPQLIWPVPERLPEKTDILLLSIDDYERDALNTLIKSIQQPKPTILVIVSYEDPATLQKVLESGAMAVLGRPVKPFGLLSNLAISRQLWHQNRELNRDARRYKRKLKGDQVVMRAKTILMSEQRLNEDQAHHELRTLAMKRRVAIEQLAMEIVEIHEDSAGQKNETE
ncbi:ANTAR domain-containing response regulator [Roseibium algae]|uniref:ANTAR domain-containing protein n=1 Tax=Roseibium algae TaxID=3123038 RepID=A0ABU8TRZ1_9HYPH